MGLYEMGIDIALPEKQMTRLEEMQKKVHEDAQGIKVAMFGLTAVIAGLVVVDYMKARH
jgi:hypothetical protein